jgi:hypothetical protein
MVSTKAAYVGNALSAARCSARTIALGATRRPKRSANNVAIFPNDRPNCLFSTADIATASGPICTAAAPSASDVLQRMAALDAPPAPATPTDVNVEAPDARQGGWQVFLILDRHVRVIDRGPAIGAGSQQRYVVGLVDHRRDGASSLASTPSSWLATRSARPRNRRALREGGRLPEARTPGSVQLLAQPFVLALQPIPVSLCALKFCTQPVDLLSLLLDQVASGWFRPIAHAIVMPELRAEYKSNRL